MLIIWGSKVVRKLVDRAPVLCPICRTITASEYLVVRRIEHLYYVPIGRGKVLGHECLCHTCRTQWRVDFDAPPTRRKARRRASASELLEECAPGELEALTDGMHLLQRVRNGACDEQTRLNIFLQAAAALEYHHANRPRVGFLVVAFSVAAVLLTIVAPISWFVQMDPTNRLSVAWPIAFTIAFVASVTLTAWSIRRARFRTRDEAVRGFARSLAPLNPSDHDLVSVTTKCLEAGFRQCAPSSPEVLHREIQRVLAVGPK